MIFVFSCFWYAKSDTYEIREHIFDNFERACLVVAEMMQSGTRNIYTIVDNREFDGDIEYSIVRDRFEGK